MIKFKIKNRKAGISRKTKVMSIESQARYMVGDGKTPNKYFVTISEDYNIIKPNSNTLVPVSEVFKDFKPKGKTIKVFDSYSQAREYSDNFLLGRSKEDGIRVNSVYIEDRLSGQVFSADIQDTEGFSYIKLTQDQEKKLGVKPTA